ncbi:glycoside hydrolase family 3 C-terminal domain-containing protein [Pseudomonas sp. KU26590]|uniref:beta-glucosidase family protein n=1 Tax=Pseudomonas sp. KU26590 TaxID=2991051 RepID=UPI00223E4607|nr:glycoside hydrolase family 3 C-terminal domain-containing protein [Pseudomonas sp. KU26590]UZJ57941.1 glycoside hydrolase family 3 C-terminal domain-containing protein [Pseudomonas sp. KU26590]
MTSTAELHDQNADEQARVLVAQMTDDEKFSWLSGPMAIPLGDTEKPEGALGSAGFFPGIPRLGIPPMQQSDASLGVGNLADVRPGDHATGLPSSLLLGATFNPEVAFESGALVGREARSKGFNVQLAGGANLIREPRGGRNFEYVSEDPLLTGVIAGHSIAGIQSEGVVSTLKHFAVNAQETGRVMVSSNLSEAALRESDLLAFQLAIEIGQPGSIMPGYNLINGEYASQNAFLLNEVLKRDWRYPGWVMSDWGATHSTIKAALAGLDVQSGANLDDAHYFGQALRQAVTDGHVPQSRIDDMVTRILRSLISVGALDQPTALPQPIDYSHHRLVAQRQAEEGIVLLKNTDAALPLPQRAKRLLVVGAHADHGVLCGGGSSCVTPIGSLSLPGTDIMGMQVNKVYQPSSPLQAIREESAAQQVDFLDGTDKAVAVAQARIADAVVIFAQEWRSEALDAKGLGLPDDQDALIEALAAVNPKTIVVLQSGGPVLMPWLDKVSAVLAAWYPGSGGGPAIAGALFGRVNPSGHLPVTFPASEQQLPRPGQIDPATTTSNPGMPRIGDIIPIDYDIEGSDVGYRWFAREGLAPLFPFGYGLSYTRFELSECRITRREPLTITADVENTGERDGAIAVQVYVQKLGTSGFAKRLAGFQKVFLKAGERAAVEIKPEPRILAQYDTGSFEIRSGDYKMWVARDANDEAIGLDYSIP